MAKKTLRITIPKKVGDLLALSKKIYDKHQTDGTKSPLNSMKDFNWNDIGPNIIIALGKHNEAGDLQKQMEKIYKERDALVGDIKGLVLSSRDVLKGTYKKFPKTLGDWGYVVDDSPKVKEVKQ